MKKNETLWYSAGGVIAVAAILILANFVLGAFKTRLDLTDGKLYTLSEGTRQILSKLDQPVRIRFYYSQGDANVPLPIKGFASRVEDLLGEFRQAGRGKVIIEKLDPRPDSEAEDSAGIDGVEAQQLPNGERFYLGLSVSYADQKLAVPALSFDRERLIEYDLARAIARAARPEKPVIGVMSAMQLFGGPGMPMMGMPPSEKQVFISELERDFRVKRVPLTAKSIDEDIQVLVVVHPRGIDDDAQYAIDQFVMRGGKLIAMVDPYAFFDQLPGPAGMSGGTTSNLDKLMKAWGITMDPAQIVSDMKFISGSGQRSMPTVLTLTEEAFDRDDVSTNRIGTTLMPFVGAFGGKPVDGLKQTVLMRTSTYSQFVDSGIAQERGEKAVSGFKPSGTEHPIAIRLTGTFKSAFPDGPPAPKDDKKPAAKPAAKAAKSDTDKPQPAAAHLAQGKGENAVVLVADSDFINDGAAVNIQEIFGQRIVVPANGNLAFAQALVEQFAGDPALVSLRSRASAARPFTVIREMEARAQQAYLGKIKELEQDLQQTQEKLGQLQKARGPGGGAVILSAEQQTELENFRKRAAETRRVLKEVRRDLRSDSEALQFWTKVVNIALVPLLVVIAGIALAVIRRRRAARGMTSGMAAS